MAKQVSTFRLDDRTLESIESLAGVLDIRRPDVITRAVAALSSLVLSSYREAEQTIRLLQERYRADSHLAAFVYSDSEGNPAVDLRIDADLPDDFVAVAILPPRSDHALVLLDAKSRDPDADRAALELKLVLAAHTGVVLGLCLGQLAWPPRKGDGIVLRLDELVPNLPEDTPARLELIGA
jgi:hypothetical protein